MTPVLASNFSTDNASGLHQADQRLRRARFPSMPIAI